MLKKTLELQMLQLGIVTLSPDNPYTWASGWKSPIYTDNRKLLSYPQLRREIVEALANLAVAFIGDASKEKIAIAGVATAGIPWGALTAEKLDLPFVYVRASKKDHGLNNRIEGRLPKGTSVVVIEDLVSTGGSSLEAVEALQDAGAEVLGMAAVFTYGFDQAKGAFAVQKISLKTVTDYGKLIAAALDTSFISDAQMDLLVAWRKSPDTWGQPQLA